MRYSIKQTISKYIYLLTFLLLMTSFSHAQRMTGRAISEAITTLTRQYIPQAMQKEFTQEEYEQWFDETNNLFNRLKASKPEAVTRGTPSIEEQFEQAIKRQLSQLQAQAITTQSQADLGQIIQQDIIQADEDIANELKAIEQELIKTMTEEKHITQELEELEKERQELGKREQAALLQAQQSLEKLQREQEARERALMQKEEQVVQLSKKEEDALNAAIKKAKKEVKAQQKAAQDLAKQARKQRIAQIKRLLDSMEDADIKEQRITAQAIAKIIQEHMSVLTNKINAIKYTFSWADGITFSDSIDIGKEQDSLDSDIQAAIDEAFERYSITDKTILNALFEALNNAYTTLAKLQYLYAQKIISAGWSIIKDHIIDHPLTSKDDPKQYDLQDALNNPLEHKDFFKKNSDLFEFLGMVIRETLDENANLIEPIPLEAHIKPFGTFKFLGRDIKKSLDQQKTAKQAVQKIAQAFIEDIDQDLLTPIRAAYEKYVQEAADEKTEPAHNKMLIIGTYHDVIAGEVNGIILLFNDFKLFDPPRAEVPEFDE